MLKTFLINKIFGNKGIHCTVLNNIAFQIHYIRRGQGENHAQVLHKMAPPPFYPILGLMSSLVDISGSHTRWRPPQFFHILGLMSSLVEIFGSRTRWHPPPTFYPIWVLCRRWQVPWVPHKMATTTTILSFNHKFQPCRWSVMVFGGFYHHLDRAICWPVLSTGNRT